MQSQAITTTTTTDVVAAQNDTEDISNITNPTKKKRRLNVSYEQLKENATTPIFLVCLPSCFKRN